MIYVSGAAFDPPHVGHSAIVRALLHYKNPEKIILMPSGKRNDKEYNVSDTHRLAMLEMFCDEIWDTRVYTDDYFLKNWEGEMITRDVDIYARGKYAAKMIRKLFVPRGSGPQDISTENLDNFGFFTDSHIPDISSTEIRATIPEHTGLKELFEENPKFIIKWLSNKISRYILENRLYRPRLEKKPKILVHVCCGPDVTMPILQLRDEYDVICFWYDPNIQPKAEYDKRYEAFVKICEIEDIPYIKGAYDVGNFFSRIKWVEHTPERGEKCTYCYDMRMMVSAKLAKRLKIPYYTSSLNTSPKKDLEKLFKMGHLYGEKYGVEFLDIPFRKRGGFEKSVEYTREHDIYRQNYCGCIYSIREWGESEMKKRMVG